ncbi:hypothetical protein [Armatimonas sp.]|uniref:hypothetical protein n=1 Tax=Armatimonas sp. TaxID=1872638 RepID=UPI00374FF155
MASSRTMPLSRKTLLLGSAGLTLTGCGGGTPMDPATLPRVRPRVTIKWATATRALEGPASANYVEIRVRSLVLPELSVSINRARPEPPATIGVELPLELPLELPVGAVELTVRFYYANNPTFGWSDSSKILVAVALGQVELKAPGGTLPDVAVEGFLASVAVTPGQGIPLEGTRELAYTARDRDGNLLAMPSALGVFEVVEGQDVLQREAAPGIFRGLRVGTAKVRVRVDGIVSVPTSVDVAWLVPFQDGFRMSQLPLKELVWDTVRRVFWGVRGEKQDQIVALDPTQSGLGASVTVAGGVRDIVLTPDSQALYFYAVGQNAIRRLTLDDMTLRESLTVPTFEVGGIVEPGFWPLPGASNRVMVAWSWNGGSKRDDVRIFDGTVARPKTLQVLQADLGNVNGISADDEGRLAYISSVSSGYRVEIGPEGFGEGTLVNWPLGTYDQGLLFGVASIYDAATGAELKSRPFGGSSVPQDRVARGRPYLQMEGDGFMGALKGIDRSAFVERGRLVLPYTQSITYHYYSNRYFPWGERGVALLLDRYTQISLLVHDAMPGW